MGFSKFYNDEILKTLHFYFKTTYNTYNITNSIKIMKNMRKNV